MFIHRWVGREGIHHIHVHQPARPNGITIMELEWAQLGIRVWQVNKCTRTDKTCFHLSVSQHGGLQYCSHFMLCSQPCLLWSAALCLHPQLFFFLHTLIIFIVNLRNRFTIALRHTSVTVGDYCLCACVITICRLDIKIHLQHSSLLQPTLI